MKFFINSLSFVLLSTLITSLCSAQEHKNFSICNEIKKLDPERTTRNGWQQLSNRLAANNLTVCDCMHYISQQREQKALNEVQKEWSITEQQMKIFKDALEKMNNRDKQFTPHIIFTDDKVAPALQELIKKKASDLQITVPIHVSAIEKFNDFAQVARGVNEDLDAQEHVFLKLNAFHAHPDNLFLPRYDAILEHELRHIKHNHTGSKMILGWLVDKEDTKNPFASKSFQKLQRARETQADRVGQACCTDLETTQNFLRFLDETLYMDKKHGVDSNDKTIQPNHPTTLKRYLWAIKINNLRILEEQKNK
jgi:hypothetical protein